jgi:predicted nucleic acid-binding protein
VVYDAGALVAAERGEQRFRALHHRWLAFEIAPVVPSPVLTQVWRNGARLVGLTRTLSGCRVLPITDDVAKHAGVLLGRSRTNDAIDAIVIATALRYDAVVVTSDPDDLRRLWDAADACHEIGLVVP